MKKPNEESNGVLVNNFDEFKTFIAKVYKCGWDKSPDKQLIDVFGCPKCYPVVITLRKNSLDAWNNIQLHFVYVKKVATVYTYRESYYD